MRYQYILIFLFSSLGPTYLLAGNKCANQIIDSIKKNSNFLDQLVLKKPLISRRYDRAQRVELEKIEQELGNKKKILLGKYNNKNAFILDSRDQIYLAGLTDLLEKELKAKGFSRVAIKKEVRKKVNDIMKRCEKIKKKR